MRFRFPKPLHGWHEFVHEIIIVVIGVLLALAGAELVENWRWQWQVGSTRRSIANELVLNANQAAGRLAVEDCMRDRIGELAARLKATSGRWTGDPMPVAPGSIPTPHWENRSMGRVYAVPLVGWSQDAWDTAKSSGVADHMSHEEVASYSALYGEIAGIRDFQDQELTIESSLSFLSTDQELDLSSRNDALAKLGQLDALNAVNAGLSSLIVEQVKTLHLPVDRVRGARELRQMIADARSYRGNCVKDVRVDY
jgi:hypothetical protein